MVQVARYLIHHMDVFLLEKKFLIIDVDGKFMREFQAVMSSKARPCMGLNRDTLLGVGCHVQALVGTK